jgi:hypothetical protein
MKHGSRYPLTLLVAAMAACGSDEGVGPGARSLTFDAAAVQWVAGETVLLTLRNGSGDRLGPIAIRTGRLRDAAGLAQPGAAIVGDPPAIATLAGGASVTLRLTLAGAGALQPGTYRSRVTAQAEAGPSVEIDATVEVPSGPSTPVASLRLTAPGTLRQGDVVRLETTATDTQGATIVGATPRFTVSPGDAGWISPDGRFVAYRDGPVRIAARAGTATDSVTLVVSPRARRITLRQSGEGLETARFTSDLWVHGDHAWTGSWGVRASDQTASPGNLLRTWRLGPGDPVATDSLILDARTTNDVKVSADGQIGVVTHEGSDDGLNGVTLLDLSDPSHPKAVGRITEGLASGVHNAWLDGEELYLVVDGVGSGLRVFDVSDPTDPRLLASYWAGESFLHDVIVRDGLAFLAHWDAGLVILDVGADIAGGSPGAPLEVGRLRELGGETHNVWYWPERGVAFVGEEDFGSPGRMHVVDVSEPRAPREIATFAASGLTPHNFWLDEEAEVLYLAWYDAGVRALDVSGELLGELDRQDRLMGEWTRPGERPACWSGMGTCTWAPQLHDGRLFLSDVNRGLVVLTPDGG